VTYLIDHLRIPGVPQAGFFSRDLSVDWCAEVAAAGLGELVAQVGVAEVAEPVGLSHRDAAAPGDGRDRVAGRVQPHDPGGQLGQHTAACTCSSLNDPRTCCTGSGGRPCVMSTACSPAVDVPVADEPVDVVKALTVRRQQVS
jgi:hypothetical protein